MDSCPETLRGKILFIARPSYRGTSIIVICQSRWLCTHTTEEIIEELKKLCEEGLLSEKDIEGKVHYCLTEMGNEALEKEIGED